MEEPAEQSQGIVASLQRLLRTLLSVAQNRLELLLVEVQEERARVFEAFLLVAGVVAFGSMTLAMTAVAVVAIFWENHRVAALVILSLLYLATTLLVYWRLHRHLKNWPAFSATVAELKKDTAWLDGKR